MDSIHFLRFSSLCLHFFQEKIVKCGLTIPKSIQNFNKKFVIFIKDLNYDTKQISGDKVLSFSHELRYKELF